MDMESVFDDKAEQPNPSQGEQPTQEPTTEPAEGAGAPPAPDTEKHVPLAALEAERKGRQDWKEKAIRFEEEAKQLRERMQERPQEPREPQDPLVSLQQQMVNERFNTSEMLARDKFADLDDVVAVFTEEARKNPALAAQMNAHPHPWKFAYDEGKRMKFAAEIGNDPVAYRAKVEAEIRASLQQSAAPAAPQIPQSLAGARSAGARGTTFTGPTPIDALFPN